MSVRKNLFYQASSVLTGDYSLSKHGYVLPLLHHWAEFPTSSSFQRDTISCKPVKHHMGSLIVPCASVVLHHRTIIQFKEPLKTQNLMWLIGLQKVHNPLWYSPEFPGWSQVWKTAIYNTYVIYESYIYHVDINYSTITSLHITPAIHSCQWTKQFPHLYTGNPKPNDFSLPVPMWLSIETSPRK